MFSPEFLRIMTVWSVIPMYLVFGGLLGWGVDYVFHTFPFGIAIGLLAGLVFAVRDSMRLRKEFHRPDGPTDDSAR
jgi:F0F1-type ATP synthase assembly protein I